MLIRGLGLFIQIDIWWCPRKKLVVDGTAEARRLRSTATQYGETARETARRRRGRLHSMAMYFD